MAMRQLLFGDAARFRKGDTVWVQLPWQRVCAASGRVITVRRGRVELAFGGAHRWFADTLVGRSPREARAARRREGGGW